MPKFRKGDEVVVLTGKDRGKRGVVLRVIKDTDKIVVENINVVKRHTKPNPAKGVQGGIIEKEMPIHISNIAIWNSLSKTLDRIGVKTLEDGKKVRIFKSNSEVIDV